jgi:hypothetical protein
MRDPVSLRNISEEVMQMAVTLAQRTHLSIADVLRLSLESGILIEAIRAGPDQSGTYAGLDEAFLVKVVRRRLASAIDLLIEHGQLPYQGLIPAPPAPDLPATPHGNQEHLPAHRIPEPPMFDAAFSEELEALGIGQGLSATMREEGEHAPQTIPENETNHITH